MKRLLLLSVAALALTASAQELSRAQIARQQGEQPMPVDVEKTKATNVVLQASMASEDVIAARRAARAEAVPTAFYARPNGSYYGVCDQDGSGYWTTPNIWVPTWRDVTFLNQSTDASSAKWTFQYYSTTAIDPEDGLPGMYLDDGESDDIDLVTSYINGEMPTAPVLEVTGAGGTATYQLHRNKNANSDLTGEVTRTNGRICSSLDPANRMGDEYYGMSPKCFAAGSTDPQGGYYNTTTYTGATGATGADDDNSGYWFGRNWSGWNAMGVFYEAPEYRYALRNVMVQYHSFQLFDDFAEDDYTITARVYKVINHNESNDETIELGDLICQGSANLNDMLDESGEMLEEGILIIPMQQYDEEGGYYYEEPADIDCDIFVMVSGYDHENISKFTMSIASNGEDEGHGYIAYMVSLDEDGEFIINDNPQSRYYGRPEIIELDNFFMTSVGNTAPTIYIDIEQPIMEWNWSDEDGEVEIPVEGGKVTRTHTTEDGVSVEEGLSIFTNKDSSQFYNPVTSTGEEAEYDIRANSYTIDGWLNVWFEDQYETDEETGEEEFSYVVLACMGAEALPEDITGRETTFYINFPGGRLQVHAVQGEVESGSVAEDVNNDGKVNAADVNVIIAEILAHPEGDGDKKYDVNNDDKVNAADANVVLAYILNNPED